MNATVCPASGLLVYCADCRSGSLGSMALYMNDTWNIFSTTCLNPVSPISATYTAGSTLIVWNWSSGSGNTF